MTPPSDAGSSGSPSDPLDPPEFLAAAGDCLCPVCGHSYRSHPFDPRYLFADSTGIPQPWLNRLCDGTLVKL